MSLILQNELILADSLEKMKDIQRNSIDMIFADPYYYADNTKTKNAFEDDVYWDFTEKYLKEFKRIIKPSNHIFVSFSPQKMAKFEFLLAKLEIPIKSRIVWHYRNAGGRCADKSSFGKTYEMIYHLGKDKHLNFNEKWSDERFDVWTISIPQSNYNDKKVHPFQKPIELLNKICTLGSFEGDLILDPFAGSGTTAIACMNTNRNYICIEKDEKYFKIMQDRITNHCENSNKTLEDFPKNTVHSKDSGGKK